MNLNVIKIWLIEEMKWKYQGKDQSRKEIQSVFLFLFLFLYLDLPLVKKRNTIQSHDNHQSK